jgi:hypothetical protein
MVFDAADFVNERARRVDDALLEQTMNERFDHPRQQWQTILGVPDQMEIYQAVIVVRHVEPVFRAGSASY